MRKLAEDNGRWILLHGETLRSLITRPKYLDSLALRFDPASYEHEWVGESDLLAWFWQVEVAAAADGSARAEVLKKLASRLGDSLRADVAADEFAVAEHVHVDRLIRDRICRRRNERITVAHDRIGDWARQRVLLGRIDELPQFLADRLDSPLWLLALRLLGIQLLEQEADVERWTRLLEQLGAMPSGERAQDALLEATLFAQQSDVLLEKVWPVFAANCGRLLGRLLNRFGHTGTLPHALFSHLPAEQAMHLTDVRYRVPIAHYWPALLRLLHAHRNEAIEFAPGTIAALAGCWLENGPANGAARPEAAALAVAVGRRALAWTRQKNFYLEGEQGVPFFRAALLAAAELPDEVAAFGRDAAFRLPEQLSMRRYVEVTTNIGLGDYSGYYPPPWLDGPARDLHESFQRAVLDNATLAPLMRMRPDAAKEVLLAALIAPPQEPDPHLRENSFLADKLCLDEGSDYSLANPFRGPFLSLLHVNAHATIDAIVRMTNFAAERWTTTPRASHARPREVVVRFGETERTLLGDYNVFTWYRSGPCPHVLTGALMALEFWFTERMLVGTAYEDAAAKLLKLTNNVAIAGLLCAVGCQQPELFAGVLSPLVTAPEFHDWEMARRIAPDIGAMFSSRTDEKLVRTWTTQPWRQRGLDEIAFELFRTDEAFRGFIEPVTARWEERANVADAPPRFKFLVEQMAPRFRRGNYRVGMAGAPLEYLPPTELLERNAVRQQQLDAHSLPHQFPFHCRGMLQRGTPMADTELESFWRRLEFIAALNNLPPDETGVMQKETSYCAAAAVLFILHRPWLRAHPDREQWLIERLTSCILQPPPPALMDNDRDIWGYDWSAYAALAVPVLWQESPDAPATRRLVARLATYRKYKTVEYLCGAAAARRFDLGEHFIELLEFVCDWAVEKQRAEGRRFDEKAYDLAPWLEREVEAFASRGRARKTVPWQHLSVKVEPPLPLRPNVMGSMRYTFDVELWHAAFTWMPRPRALTDLVERDWLLSFWRHHLALALQRLNAEPRDEDSRDCTPYGVEQWLLKSIACAVLDLPGREERASFWQPIFSTAPHGAHWIEDFANELLAAAQTDAQSASAFVETWPHMVEWAFDAPGWAYSWGTSFTFAQAWRALLGLKSAAEFLRVCSDHLVEWKHYFVRWAADWLAERRCAVLFCGFLEDPRASALLPDGLSCLNEKLPPESLRHQPDVAGAVGELLVLLVRTRRGEVIGNLRTLKAFRGLLSRLSEIQHPRAVEIETLLAGSEGG